MSTFDNMKIHSIFSDAEKIKMFDGHCSDISRLEDETASLKSRIAELEAMIAAKDEALRFYAEEIGYMAGVDMPAEVYTDGGHKAKQALALTPSEAVEAARKKDELIKRLVRHLSRYRKGTSLGGQPQIISQLAEDVIEAARAAGVEVEG